MKTEKYKRFARYSDVEYTDYVYEPHFSKFCFGISPGLFVPDYDARPVEQPLQGSCRFLPKVPKHLAGFSRRSPDMIFLHESCSKIDGEYSYKFISWPSNEQLTITDPEKLEAAERLYIRLIEIKTLMRKCVQGGERND